MTTEYYNPSGSPSTGSTGSSATMRTEFTAIQAGFALLPGLSGNGALPVFVNAGGTALEAASASTARIRLALGSIATQNANNVAITGGTMNNVVVTNAGLGTMSSQNANNVAITGGTISGVSQLASNNVTITGGTANNLAITGGSISGVSEFASGTRLVFQQTSSPTGWTKSATHNDKALRVVSGTVGSGGATAFTTVFGSGKTVGAHTLTTSEIPAHAHFIQGWANSVSNSDSRPLGSNTGGGGLLSMTTATDGGSGGSHDHTLSLDLQYMDVIVAAKD